MKPTKESIVSKNEPVVRRLRNGRRGQVIALTVFFIVATVALAAFVIDVARLYNAYQELRTSTQAAALAGGWDLATDTASGAQAKATSYSAGSGDLNGNSNFTMVSGYPKVQAKCLTSSFLPSCSALPSGDNAIIVQEQATVPTFFARVLGLNSWTISATATASARGGNSGPYNVAILVDTTQSMSDTDSDSQCDNTRIHCALTGVRTLLGTLSPCPPGLASCGAATNGNVANPLDEVSLFVFPGLASAADASNDYTGSCTMPSGDIVPYNDSPVYEIVPLSSDYRASDTATSLISSSHLVIAAGGGSCSGLSTPGGEGTFYAGAITQTQNYLTANARPNTKNVMIILSDGDATATGSAGYITSASPGCTTKGVGDMAGCGSSYTTTHECSQAVTAAQAAKTAGTIVYSVAYGAESSGCSGDVITPCQTMQNIASSAQNFFSDYTATGSSGSCVSAARPTSSLNQIFTDIGEDLTVSRLIPNGTT